jgi:hypothetical protein
VVYMYTLPIHQHPNLYGCSTHTLQPDGYSVVYLYTAPIHPHPSLYGCLVCTHRSRSNCSVVYIYTPPIHPYPSRRGLFYTKTTAGMAAVWCTCTPHPSTHTLAFTAACYEYNHLPLPGRLQCGAHVHPTHPPTPQP